MNGKNEQKNKRKIKLSAAPGKEDKGVQKRGNFQKERQSHSPFLRVRVVGRRKHKQRKAVPGLTSKGNRGVRVLVNSCITDLGGVEMCCSRKSVQRSHGRGVVS